MITVVLLVCSSVFMLSTMFIENSKAADEEIEWSILLNINQDEGTNDDTLVFGDGRSYQVWRQLQNRVIGELRGEAFCWELHPVAFHSGVAYLQVIPFRPHRLDPDGLAGRLRRCHDGLGGEVEIGRAHV